MTIQEAINAAGIGDTVILAPGTYDEPFTLYGKAISVVGAGMGETIIDGGPIQFIYAETNATVLEDMTLTGGQGESIVTISSSSPTLWSIEFTENHAVYGGGLTISDESDPVIESCIFDNNEAAATGGGVFI